MGIDSAGFWKRIQKAFAGANSPKIAELTGRTKTTVYRWRDGQLPDLDVLVLIAESRRVSLHWLVTGQGPESFDDAGEAGRTAGVESPSLRAADLAEMYEAMARDLRSRGT